jgi:hypothetical protein
MQIVILNKPGGLQFSGAGQELGETDKSTWKKFWGKKTEKSISCYFI